MDFSWEEGRTPEGTAAASDLDQVCLACGACCASFRCSFHWAEGDDAPGGWVPTELTEPSTPFLRAMKGTLAREPRCIALVGTVGEAVSCAIYELRPSTCRNFLRSGQNGKSQERCDQARREHHLPPLVEEALDE